MEVLVLLSGEYPQLPLGAHAALKEKGIWLNEQILTSLNKQTAHHAMQL